MDSEKKWVAVIVEVETFDGEVEAVHPVGVETAGSFSKDELEAVIKFLKEHDDADFDFMWELRSCLIKESGSDQNPRRNL